MKNKHILPEAFYDGLSISNKLGDTLIDFRKEEIHLFSYFSSILFLYKGNPIADWKYSFILDSNGYPFSDALDEVIKRHILNGLIKEGNNFLRITTKGINEFLFFKEMQNLSKREEFIKAACFTNIILPYSKTMRSLLNDPEITKIKNIASKQNLDIDNVYQEFSKLSKAIGVNANDLVIPAVTWINYISER